jgi:hypothetical protein
MQLGTGKGDINSLIYFNLQLIALTHLINILILKFLYNFKNIVDQSVS